jgi:hypothetical protein
MIHFTMVASISSNDDRYTGELEIMAGMVARGPIEVVSESGTLQNVREGQRVTPPERNEEGGHRLPSGAIVEVNIRKDQHIEIYGVDPKIFGPRRWLEASGEQVSGRWED